MQNIIRFDTDLVLFERGRWKLAGIALSVDDCADRLTFERARKVTVN